MRWGGVLFSLLESLKTGNFWGGRQNRGIESLRLGFGAYCALLISIHAFSTLAPSAVLGPRLDARLVSRSSGWALYNGRLLWTDSGGVSWKDITPSLETEDTISSVFFLGTSYGWVTISRQTQSSLALASTADGGQTWQKNAVDAAGQFLSLPLVWSGTSYVFFLDSTNGWIELQRTSSSNFKDGILLATRDGGKHWTELPQPPTVDKMTWISPSAGWIAGGVLGGDLFATRNGGLTWQRQTPSIPNDTIDPFGHAAPPRFSDSQHGTFVMTFRGLKIDGYRSLVAVYRTSDSGKTWLRSDLQEVPSLAVSGEAADDGSPIWAHVTKGKLNTVGPLNNNSVQVPSGSTSPALDVICSSFIDADNGFLLVYGTECDGAKINCTDTSRLLFTKDAGRSVQDVTPPEKASVPLAGSARVSGGFRGFRDRHRNAGIRRDV